ncbi:MAG: peptide ABC transporter substrate-binding protein [Chlamydiota bacterium]
MVVTSSKNQLDLNGNQDLYTWALSLSKRFPNWVDFRLVRGINAILGVGAASSFADSRSFFHLKRLLITQFSLQKKIEQKINQADERPLFVRVFSIQSRLCIAIAYSKGENDLKSGAILEVASQKVPALKKVEHSSYQWTSQDLPYAFYYLELEKMRGKDLLFAAIKDLEKHLKKHLCHYISELSVFWPYNHEEAFKQLLILAKETSSAKDYPQVSIHFQKQTAHQLEFLIYLARPKAGLSQETAITSSQFPASIQLIAHLTKEINAKVPTLIEAFSILIPIGKCKKGAAINLLHAREFVSKLLENVIGTFRDYNGGLFDTQKKRFKELSRLFADKIPNFTLFGADLFYALTPVETQVCLEDQFFEKLFEGFSQVLGGAAALSRPNPYILVLEAQNPDQLISCLKQAENLQKKGKVTAYANFKVLSKHYLCLIDAKKTHLANIQFNQYTTNLASRDKLVLRLAFQVGEVASLHPYYLAGELRGRILGKLLFEGLFRLNPQYQAEHAGCQNVILSEDKKRYIFKLRTCFWSNGQKVTASHYARSWKKNFLSKDDFNPFYLLKNAEAIRRGEKTTESLGVKALDEERLQVDLERETPDFLVRLAHPAFFPCLEGSSEAKSFNGPYCLQNREEKKIVIERNPYYWDKKNIFFNKVVILFETSSDKISELFLEGKIDWIGNPCSYEAMVSGPSMTRQSPYSFFLYLNTRVFPLSSAYIRSALSCVLDRRLIAEDILLGSRPLYTPLPKMSSFCTAELMDNNLERGRDLFEQGIKQLRLTRQTFPTLKIVSCNMEKRIKLARYLQSKWQKAFGISIDVEIQDWGCFYQKMERGDFHIGGFFKGVPPLDTTPFLESFCQRERNFSRWQSKKYVDAMTLAKTTGSQKVKVQHLGEAEALLLAGMPFIPLASLVYSYTHRSGLKNYVFDYGGEVDFRFAFIQNMPNASRAFLSDQSKALSN